MESAAIQKLVALLDQNPDLKAKLLSISNIDDAVALIKSKGLEIAKQELQEYITKNLASSDLAKGILGQLGGGAGDLLKGLLGK